MNPGQQVVSGCGNCPGTEFVSVHTSPGQFYPETILSRDITSTMVSKGTNIVLLCAILTNITVIIALLQVNISLLLFWIREGGKMKKYRFLPFLIIPGYICSVRSHGKMLSRQSECPCLQRRVTRSVLVPGQLRTTCERKYSL